MNKCSFMYQQEKRTKQVVMGKLEASESFAELSILLDEPITCSIVTATPIELGIIKPESIRGKISTWHQKYED